MGATAVNWKSLLFLVSASLIRILCSPVLTCTHPLFVSSPSRKGRVRITPSTRSVPRMPRAESRMLSFDLADFLAPVADRRHGVGVLVLVVVMVVAVVVMVVVVSIWYVVVGSLCGALVAMRRC
jgi:hypothetical protein